MQAIGHSTYTRTSNAVPPNDDSGLARDHRLPKHTIELLLAVAALVVLAQKSLRPHSRLRGTFPAPRCICLSMLVRELRRRGALGRARLPVSGPEPVKAGARFGSAALALRAGPVGFRAAGASSSDLRSVLPYSPPLQPVRNSGSLTEPDRPDQ